MRKPGWVWILIVAAVFAGPAESASTRRSRQRNRLPAPKPYVVPSTPDALPSGPYQSALLLDAETGQVLYQKDAAKPWPPASMVKMMVALVALEAVQAGEVRLDQPVRASLLAARTGGSRVALRPGESFLLSELIQAMLVASANDASVAVAEAVAGSTEAMVERMNRRAKELGMTDTVYRTVNGLPPRRGLPMDMTSAQDLSVLARKLVDTPGALSYSAQSEVFFRNGAQRLRNTNHLVGQMPGVDGLKTGYFRRAGFNLTATATRDGLRLIAVVLGCPTLRSRFDVAQGMLEWGFSHYTMLRLVRSGDPIGVEIKVSNGTPTALRPVAAGDASLLVRKGESRNLRVRFQLPSVVTAPITKDQLLGEIIIHDDHGIYDVIPAVSPLDVSGHASLSAETISR